MSKRQEWAHTRTRAQQLRSQVALAADEGEREAEAGREDEAEVEATGEALQATWAEVFAAVDKASASRWHRGKRHRQVSG